jgi:hypothetical protein
MQVTYCISITALVASSADAYKFISRRLDTVLLAVNIKETEYRVLIVGALTIVGETPPTARYILEQLLFVTSALTCK